MRVQLKYFYFGFVAWRRNKFVIYISIHVCYFSRSQRPRGQRRGSAASCWLELLFRIPPAGTDVYLLRSIRRTPSQLHSLQQIPTQHDMLPQHLVYKNEPNREYVITLERNDETPWWWSEKIETYPSGFKCFKWKLYKWICWLIVEVTVISYFICKQAVIITSPLRLFWILAFNMR